MGSIAEAIRSGARILDAHSDSPRLDAQLLLGKVLGLSRSALLARDVQGLGGDCARAYAELLARRAHGTPVAYLTGRSEFWSLPLEVTSAVLIPRPETETLIERALSLSPACEPREVLDLGTGSGAIALAIASERPHWRVTGSDISPQALEVAKRNAAQLELHAIAWRDSDWFASLHAQRFDLILANPPYIAGGDAALERLRDEPAQALVSGPTGLEALAAIAAQAPGHLRAGGWLLLEHGSTQALEVAQLLAQHGFCAIETCLDYSGSPRVTLATLHTQH